MSGIETKIDKLAHIQFKIAELQLRMSFAILENQVNIAMGVRKIYAKEALAGIALELNDLREAMEKHYPHLNAGELLGKTAEDYLKE